MAPHPSAGSIGEAEYRELHIRVAKALDTNFSMAQAEAVCKTDWMEDTRRANKHGQGRLNFDSFFMSLYELAEMWVYKISTSECVPVPHFYTVCGCLALASSNVRGVLKRRYNSFLLRIFETITSQQGDCATLRGLGYDEETQRYEFKGLEQITPLVLTDRPAQPQPPVQSPPVQSPPVQSPPVQSRAPATSSCEQMQRWQSWENAPFACIEHCRKGWPIAMSGQKFGAVD
jgi:hypothetical protein